MRTTLTRADIVLRPKLVEERRKRIEELRLDRDKIMAEVMPRLIQNDDFKRFLECAIWRENLFGHDVELTPFKQGKRAAMSEFIQWSITHGGEAAATFFGAVASKYATFRQKMFTQGEDA